LTEDGIYRTVLKDLEVVFSRSSSLAQLKIQPALVLFCEMTELSGKLVIDCISPIHMKWIKPYYQKNPLFEQEIKNVGLKLALYPLPIEID